MAGNDLVNALTAFGEGYLSASQKKKEEKKEEQHWTQQMAVSMGHLKLAQDAEARQVAEYEASVQEKKAQKVAQSTVDSTNWYVKTVDEGGDPYKMHAVAKQMYGQPPSVSPEEAIAMQAKQLSSKIEERRALANIESAAQASAASRAAASQAAAMKTAALQSSILPLLEDLAKRGQVPLESIPGLSEAYARGQLPPEISGILNKTLASNAAGASFDDSQLADLSKAGLLSPGEMLQMSNAYKSNSNTPEMDAKIQGLIKQKDAGQNALKAFDDVLKTISVRPADIARVKGDPSGVEAQKFLANIQATNPEPKPDPSIIDNAFRLNAIGGDPHAAKSPEGVIDAIAGAKKEPSFSEALSLYNLGADPSTLQSVASGQATPLSALSALTGKRDEKSTVENFKDYANFAKLKPEVYAQGVTDAGNAKKALAFGALGFVPQEKKPLDNEVSTSDLTTLINKFGAKPAEALDAITDPTGAKKAAIIARGEVVKPTPENEDRQLARFKYLMDNGVPKTVAQVASKTPTSTMSTIVAMGGKPVDATAVSAKQVGALKRLSQVWLQPQFVEMTEPIGGGPASPDIDPVTGDYKWRKTPAGERAKQEYYSYQKSIVDVSDEGNN